MNDSKFILCLAIHLLICLYLRLHICINYTLKLNTTKSMFNMFNTAATITTIVDMASLLILAQVAIVIMFLLNFKKPIAHRLPKNYNKNILMQTY